MKIWRANNKEKLAIIDKRYREKHKEELALKRKNNPKRFLWGKTWYESHKHTTIAAYKEKNKDKIKEYEKSEKRKLYLKEYQNRPAVKEKRTEYMKIYNKAYQRNKQIKNALNKIREANKKQRMPIWANSKIIKEIYKDCPEGYHVDHIVPLHGETVSGLHVEYNLQYLTAAENLEKNNKFPYGDYF